MRSRRKLHLLGAMLQVMLTAGFLFLPDVLLAQGLSGTQDIPKGIEGIARYIYDNLRWPVSLLGLTGSVGLAKFSDGGVRRAKAILVGTVAWAMVPQVVTILRTILH